MKQFFVKDCTVYIISPGTDKYRHRLHKSFERLVDYGFHKIIYVKSIPDESVTKSLSLTFLSIIQSAVPPYIIVEDDICLGQKKDVFEVPDDAVALYLGVSIWVYPHTFDHIRQDGFHIRPCTRDDFRDVNEELVQILGVLSTHAILFLEKNFIRFLSQKMLQGLERPHDLYIAVAQREYAVYAYKTPVFFQDKQLGGQEDVTNLIWKDDRFIQSM